MATKRPGDPVTHLTDMRITKVSLVERGVNGRTFAVLKSAPIEAAPDPEKRSLLAKVASALGFTVADVEKAEDLEQPHPDAAEDDMPEVIAKAHQTFASLVAGQQLTEALDDQFWTLKDALWSAIYAYDEDGQLLSTAERQGLVGQSLDEFKAYLIERMNAGIAKSGETTPDPLTGGLDAVVRKVGKKISAARLERLKSAAEALAAVLAEVEVSDEESDVEKEAEMPLTDEDVARIAKAVKTPDAPSELEAAIEKALEPIRTEIADMNKGAGGADEDTIPEPIGKVFDLLLERLEKVEKAVSAGAQTSAEGQDDHRVAKSSAWKARM